MNYIALPSSIIGSSAKLSGGLYAVLPIITGDIYVQRNITQI